MAVVFRSKVSKHGLGRDFDAFTGAYGVIAALAVFLAYIFGSGLHECSSIGWGIYSAFMASGMLLFYPPFLLGTLAGVTCIFLLSGFLARLIRFRILPTTVALGLAITISACIGFALTQPVLKPCMPV